VTKGGWDRPRDRARTLGERDGNDKPLAEGNEEDDDEYGKDSNIPDDDDEYAVGVNYSASPLKRATTSAAPARACPVSQQLSVPSR
jgi:hypothetical protein